jgi:BirA family biotin operon repressor/biotin-[acetyl-CoA-carboxylase] ligase
MSLVFRPRLAPHQVQRLTMICGLGLADAIESETDLHIGLKWPNDLVAKGAKIGGILTEVELERDQVDFAVVGIGLNVNLDRDQFSNDFLMPATSLSLALGRPVPRLGLLQWFVRNLERRVVALDGGQSPHEEWAQRLSTLGQPVTVSTLQRTFAGVAEGVDADGALQIRLPDGQLETVLAGDVTLRVPQ